MSKEYEIFSIHPSLQRLADQTEEDLQKTFARIHACQSLQEAKMLHAFHNNKISATHLLGTVGYGYDDRGRDALDRIFAEVFSAEDALVRQQFVSGTHALTVALFGVLRPGDLLVSLTGAPYDTMEEVIGIREGGNGSLKDFGIAYRQLDRLPDGTVSYEGIAKAVVGAKVAYIQRSRGYTAFPSVSIAQMKRMISLIRAVAPETIVVVDNCYGEFVEADEPTAVGADLIVGSLIKNPGGGFACTGGYIAGRKELIERCANRLTAPGVGKEVGASLEQNRAMYMGFFFAPSVVAQAIKTSCFALRLFELLGFDVDPKYDQSRTDLIAAIRFGKKEPLLAFCKGIQSGSPIDSFVTPLPWDMPGYGKQVVMAAGTFTAGASIELTADAPMQDPYIVYLQGGLTYPSGKLGVLLAAQELIGKGFVNNL